MRGFVQFDREQWRKLTAVAGMVLIAAFAFLLAVHSHPGRTANEHCAICAVVNSPAVIVAPAIVPILALTHVRLFLPDTAILKADTLSCYFCRPPPPTARFSA